MIRRYQENDVVACCDLLGQLGYPSPIEELKERLAHIMVQPDYDLLVFEQEQQVVGLIAYVKMSFIEKNGSYIRIIALVVDKQYRKQGLAHALLDRVRQVAENMGCLALALNSGMADTRQAAHSFYQKYGFVKKSFGFVYELDEKTNE